MEASGLKGPWRGSEIFDAMGAELGSLRGAQTEDTGEGAASIAVATLGLRVSWRGAEAWQW